MHLSPDSCPDVSLSQRGVLETLVVDAHVLPLPLIGAGGVPASMPAHPEPGRLSMAVNGDVLVGSWRGQVRGDLQPLTRTAYELILQQIKGWHLARVWNIVPQINACSEGMENYRAFCAGRAEAYAGHFGQAATANMSAATGIGSGGPWLDISFIACREPVRHFENPEQVPAYRYPPKYGPRPPCFARASLCRACGGLVGFVSGTASVKGHESVTGGIEEECDTTIDNLRIIGRELARAGIPEDTPRVVNVFIRRPDETPVILSRLRDEWLAPHDIVRLHRADICRAELGLEIEYAATHFPADK